MILAGPVFCGFIYKKIHVPVPEMMNEQAAALADLEEIDKANNKKELPSFISVISIILLPLVLMLCNTLAPFILEEGSVLRNILVFIGHPYAEFTITTLLIFFFFVINLGYYKYDFLDIIS